MQCSKKPLILKMFILQEAQLNFFLLTMSFYEWKPPTTHIFQNKKAAINFLKGKWPRSDREIWKAEKLATVSAFQLQKLKFI
ncbi:MAG: hypothetical protein MRECE_4c039 [Mycoplasmataceae bacterium CE_OT135]|nr:MAG: hypothetical protein MRECE_4c039 [Mycoplasmataceae bacterium CE_OT135]